MSVPWQIPERWQWSHTGQVSTVVGGGTPDTRNPKYFGGDIAWLTPADLSHYTAKRVSSGARKITQEGLENSGAQVMPAGSVLFSSRAPIGYVAIAANQMCTNQGFKSFVPEGGLSSDFMYYYLLYAKPLASKLASGTTFLEISGKNAALIPIPIASPAEQFQIADALDELFSDLDAAAAALERVQAKLKLYRASILKAAVEGTLTAEWREQHPHTEPASELLKRILIERRRRWEEEQLRKFKKKQKEPPKDWRTKYQEPIAPNLTKLPVLAEGWCWATVDQVCSQVRNGYSQKPDATGDTPILRISSVRPLALDLDDVRYLAGGADQYEEFVVQRGDLLFTRYNGTRSLVAVSAVVPETTLTLVHPDKLIRGRVLAPLVSSEFVAVATNVGSSRSFLEQRIRTTAGQAGVSGSDIKQTPIPFAPLQEQEAIVEAVEDQLSVIDHLAADLEIKLKSAQALRQSILRHAFTGKLVPQDPNDEPASELLKRIAAEREARDREAVVAKRADAKAKTSRKKRSPGGCAA